MYLNTALRSLIQFTLFLFFLGSCLAIAPTVTQAEVEITQTIPNWLITDWAIRTQGNGVWTTSNDTYQSEQEPFEAYGIEWSYGIGNTYLRGRLFGILNGQEAGTFWQFTEYWDPETAQVRTIQIGPGGSVGQGTLALEEQGRIRQQQTFSHPDGRSFKSGHLLWMEEGEQHTKSFNIVDGEWQEDRYYVWQPHTQPSVPTSFLEDWQDENPAQLLILGTFHFHNPGADYAQNEVADILSTEKQLEIAELNRRLARFQPTRIALEKMPRENERIQQEYQAFRQGNFELTANEIYQLGFRLANQLDHDEMYLVDHPGGLNIDSVMRVAEQETPATFNLINRQIQTFVGEMNRMQAEENLLDILYLFNRPELLQFAQSLYANMGLIGQGEHYFGAEVAAKWYERNLKIFANLQAIAQPGERILLIVGQGHKPILEQLARESMLIDYVDVLGYLEELGPVD